MTVSGAHAEDKSDLGLIKVTFRVGNFNSLGRQNGISKFWNKSRITRLFVRNLPHREEIGLLLKAALEPLTLKRQVVRLQEIGLLLKAALEPLTLKRQVVRRRTSKES